ncbi:tyrosine-type recombinase/integrase [Colwellia sp. MB02u-9]|uniref:tyrosine-type recombinase/integrase n=1 Tax=Colwellia sp. MB02u-9 TaxID=2759823 RepID=UPI0015F5740F|nr:tyrosine-type recombinase/integrase [Colwellia sp. MB02u-9]MBA6295954.1 tyrosine-type recombinase/integrase [Colwellia sp. MB02u-9]
MVKKREIFTEKNLKKKVTKGKPGKYYVAPNIYLLVTSKVKAVWKVRFQLQKKRIEKKIGVYGVHNPYFMDYEQAMTKSIEFQRALAAEQNPLERTHTSIEALDQLVHEYINNHTCEYKKEQQIYQREIKPILGELLLKDITRLHLERLLISIVKSGRKSIAIKALYFLRGVFNYASLHNLVVEHVASHLNVEKHAGGYPSERQIYLTEVEIKNIFKVLQEYPKQAPISSQIALVLYLIFGFRKSELLSSKWDDFNFERQEWIVKPTKMGEEQLTLDVPDAVMPLFYTLRVLSVGSNPFIFPTKRKSKSGHLSESTLNAMLKKFFEEYKTRTVHFNNPLGKVGVRKFWIHDLRRTFTSSANDNEISQEVTERCLNHKKRRRLKIYDLSNRQSQRKVVYELMAEIILPLANLHSQLEQFKEYIELLKAA